MLGSTPLAAARGKPLGTFIKPTTYQSASWSLLALYIQVQFQIPPRELGDFQPTGLQCPGVIISPFAFLQPHILPKLDPTRPFSGVRTPGPTLQGEEGPQQQMLSKKGGKRALASGSIKPDPLPLPSPHPPF